MASSTTIQCNHHDEPENSTVVLSYASRPTTTFVFDERLKYRPTFNSSYSHYWCEGTLLRGVAIIDPGGHCGDQLFLDLYGLGYEVIAQGPRHLRQCQPAIQSARK